MDVARRVCVLRVFRGSKVGLAATPGRTGLPKTEGSITTKINREAYPAWWLFAVMRAIGWHALRME
jgi:hypothetical protein